MNYATKIILFREKTSGKTEKSKDSADLLTKSDSCMYFYVQLNVIFHRMDTIKAFNFLAANVEKVEFNYLKFFYISSIQYTAIAKRL